MKHCDRAEFGLQGGSNVADDSKHNVFVDWSKLPTWLYLPHRESLVPSSLLELTEAVRLSLFGLLEQSEDVQQHRVDLDDVLKTSFEPNPGFG